MTPSVALNLAEQPLVLALDVGTSSTRAIVFDARGRAIEGCEQRERAPVSTLGDGIAQDEAEALLQRAERCIDAVLLAAGDAPIAAVAVDTFVTSTLAVSAAGRALTPVVLYADTRNASDSLALRERLHEPSVHERTGCLLRTGYWPARLAWFRRSQPEIWRDAARWITAGEYLEWHWLGISRVSTSVASWSGLLDRHTLRWDTPLLDALRLANDRLAPLADAAAAHIGLTPAYAARWPTLRTARWYPAIGDGAAANIGSGCVGAGRLALTIGTTAAIRSILPAVPRVPAGLWCYRVDARRALLGGATSEGGNVSAWLRRLLFLTGGPEAAERGIAAITPDGHGLTMLPLLAGERSPGWSGDATGSIVGLTLATTQLDILRAGVESVAYRLALIADNMPSADTPVVASGGALLGSPTWMQILADVLGRTVVASADGETTARGAALLALESLGAIADVTSATFSTGRSYTPNTANTALYRAAITRQQVLYAALRDAGLLRNR